MHSDQDFLLLRNAIWQLQRFNKFPRRSEVTYKHIQAWVKIFTTWNSLQYVKWEKRNKNLWKNHGPYRKQYQGYNEFNQSIHDIRTIAPQAHIKDLKQASTTKILTFTSIYIINSQLHIINQTEPSLTVSKRLPWCSLSMNETAPDSLKQ